MEGDNGGAKLFLPKYVVCQDRRAHFEKNIPTLLQGMACQQLNVRDGQIGTQTRTEAEVRLAAYFDPVAEFVHWNDMQPPIIQTSQDGTMAWMINQIHLCYRTTYDEETDVACAWLMVYEKQDDDWVAVVNVSTFAPPEP